ncbi:MAG: hypothetical protein IPP05_22355 [Cytophagaceae bacterium]|nr:hypothetical protein [Cytophagaceae bacterium]
MKTIFNKKGMLTDYGFSCGYVSGKTTKLGEKKIYKEHGIYHVIFTNSFKFNEWVSFDTKTEALKKYNSIK